MKLHEILGLSLVVILFSGCTERAIGYKQTVGVNPYWVEVRPNGTMDFSVGNMDRVETGRWWKIDGNTIVFINQNNSARYFKFSDGSSLLDQPFRHSTNYDELMGKKFDGPIK